MPWSANEFLRKSVTVTTITGRLRDCIQKIKCRLWKDSLACSYIHYVKIIVFIVHSIAFELNRDLDETIYMKMVLFVQIIVKNNEKIDNSTLANVYNKSYLKHVYIQKKSINRIITILYVTNFPAKNFEIISKSDLI